jgi:hypothetical protein
MILLPFPKAIRKDKKLSAMDSFELAYAVGGRIFPAAFYLFVGVTDAAVVINFVNNFYKFM